MPPARQNKASPKVRVETLPYPPAQLPQLRNTRSRSQSSVHSANSHSTTARSTESSPSSDPELTPSEPSHFIPDHIMLPDLPPVIKNNRKKWLPGEVAIAREKITYYSMCNEEFVLQRSTPEQQKVAMPVIFKYIQEEMAVRGVRWERSRRGLATWMRNSEGRPSIRNQR